MYFAASGFTDEKRGLRQSMQVAPESVARKPGPELQAKAVCPWVQASSRVILKKGQPVSFGGTETDSPSCVDLQTEQVSVRTVHQCRGEAAVSCVPAPALLREQSDMSLCFSFLTPL